MNDLDYSFSPSTSLSCSEKELKHIMAPRKKIGVSYLHKNNQERQLERRKIKLKPKCPIEIRSWQLSQNIGHLFFKVFLVFHLFFIFYFHADYEFAMKRMRNSCLMVHNWIPRMDGHEDTCFESTSSPWAIQLCRPEKCFLLDFSDDYC